MGVKLVERLLDVVKGLGVDVITSNEVAEVEERGKGFDDFLRKESLNSGEVNLEGVSG